MKNIISAFLNALTFNETIIFSKALSLVLIQKTLGLGINIFIDTFSIALYKRGRLHRFNYSQRQSLSGRRTILCLDTLNIEQTWCRWDFYFINVDFPARSGVRVCKF